MKIGPFEVDVAPVTNCDLCLKGAILDIDGQPLCLDDAGVKLASEPAVLGELVLRALYFQKNVDANALTI